MHTRASLIAELADEIACGSKVGGVDAAYFLDSLINESLVTSDDTGLLYTAARGRRPLTDAHQSTVDRIEKLIRAEAAKWFTTNPRGIEHINETLAKSERDEQDERLYRIAAQREIDGQAA